MAETFVQNESIETVIQRYKATVYSVALSYVNNREDADDIVMVNFGTHPDSVGGDYISADYMGYVCDIMEKSVPNIKCMFFLYSF